MEDSQTVLMLAAGALLLLNGFFARGVAPAASDMPDTVPVADVAPDQDDAAA